MGGVRRRAQVVFSPHLPAGAGGRLGGDEEDEGAACDFEVREDGVWGIEADDR